MRNGKPKGNGENGHPATASKSRLSGRIPAEESSPRLPILKTYKIFIGGKFPRTESGRFYLYKNPRSQEPVANVCLSSRKDFRESVVAARTAQGGWASRSAYNRGQIIYRIAEMLEGRSGQFVDEMIQQGITEAEAKAEVAASVDRLVYYAGWADKYQQIFSSVNPVASSHFNFSVLEPTGVVSILTPQSSALIGLISTIIPAITGGNSVVALARRESPLCAVTFAEVLATSDLPGGVVNILTGDCGELIEHFANHMDVNAVIYCGNDDSHRTTIRGKSSLNVKRAICYDRADWLTDDAANPYFILDTQEVKTTWHPIGT
ncbi:MAG: aldehyde dehydrogenase family protein [Tepidisphaeraceae bacterium]|jgi:acyl-CoA reductase-like NAD-dependent aldehyde dehydrogenase